MPKKWTTLLLFITLIAGMISISISYAWFDDSQSLPTQVSGLSKKQYFSKGTGTISDPFIISNAQHIYNLTKLQEMGILNTKYYFKVAHPTTGSPLVIDFNEASLPNAYRTLFKPIGDHIYPFLGEFDGNFSVIQNVTINGSLKQDIGFFGLVGNGAVVKNFFLEKPTIQSNPLSTDSRLNFHSHGILTSNVYSTGIIVGHLLTTATISKVYVIEPQILSSNNAYFNGSQFGLIGFASANTDGSDGGISNAYYFELTTAWTHDFIRKAVIYDSTTPLYLANGQRITTVLSYSGTTANLLSPSNLIYSLSTLKVSKSSNFSNPILLYDLLKNEGIIVPTAGSNYNPENIDVVGPTTISTSNNTFSFSPSYSTFTAPSLGTTFNSRNYSNTIVLYVKATGSANLGQVTATYSQSGELSYMDSFIPNASLPTGYQYVPGTGWNNKNDLVNFGTSGSTTVLSIANAFAAVTKNASGVLTVVNPNVTTPNYYVFLLGISNGNSTVNQVSFRYVPASASDFAAIYDVDIINNVSEVTTNPMTYTNADVYFTYSLQDTHKLNIKTIKASDSSGYVFRIYLSSYNAATGFLYIDVVNVNMKRIEIYTNGALLTSNTSKQTTIRISGTTVTFNTS